MKFPKIDFTKFIKVGEALYKKYDNLTPEQKEKAQELVQKLYDKFFKKDE